jgi:hypothetical protein
MLDLAVMSVFGVSGYAALLATAPLWAVNGGATAAGSGLVNGVLLAATVLALAVTRALVSSQIRVEHRHVSRSSRPHTGRTRQTNSSQRRHVSQVASGRLEREPAASRYQERRTGFLITVSSTDSDSPKLWGESSSRTISDSRNGRDLQGHRS